MATIKQKLAVVKIMENHGNVSKSMREVGYTGATAENPSNLTESKGFQELMEKYLPDKELMEVHKKGLKATIVRFTPEGDMIKVEDFATRHKYLETGYKVKGKLKETPLDLVPHQTVIIINTPNANTRGDVQSQS